MLYVTRCFSRVKATSTNLLSSCGPDVGGVAEGGVSQDFLVQLRVVLLGRPGLCFFVEARASRDHVSRCAKAGALRHGPAAQDLAHHGQAARALGDNAAVSADLSAGLLQRRQQAHPVHSMMVHVSCLSAPLPCFALSTDSVTCVARPTVAREGQNSAAHNKALEI